MRIVTLQLSCFRNIRRVETQLGPSVNLLVGGNGQGKTNFVEAVTFLSWMRSFRTAKTADLPMHGCEAAGIMARIEGARGSDLVEVTVGRGFRKVQVSGKAVRAARQMLAVFPLVCMSPEDPAVLSGGPEGRRLLLDRLAGIICPESIADLTRYERLLRERNHLLKDASRGATDPVLMAAQEETLAAAGAQVGRIRLEALERLMQELPSTLAYLAGEDLGVSVEYRPVWHTDGNPAESLLSQLRSRRAIDLALGYTGVGPHADDLTVQIRGYRARGLASRGQLKIVLLGWKSAEARLISALRGMMPVMVLDDVLGDLDLDRQARVLRFLGEYEGQSFLTSPVPMAGPGREAFVFEVKSGNVVTVAGA